MARSEEEPMSDANVKLVQDCYEAFKRGDIATIIAALSPDIDWQVHGKAKSVPTIGRWKGQNGVQEFFRTVADHQEVSEFAPKEFHAAGDNVFVLGRYGWKVRKSGKALSAEWCHVFTFRNGKVSQFREFTDTAAFAEAYRG
jgi:ketosteroid isomerase-like protein